MEFTPSFWMILGLTLVLGWVLGLMSRSGGGKWKRELKTERDRYALELKERDARLTAANARIAELERARPVVHPDDRPRDSAIDNLDLTRRDAHRDPVRP